MDLWHWLVGYDRYRFLGAPEWVFQRLMELNLPYRQGRIRKDGGEFCASWRLRKRIAEEVFSQDIRWERSLQGFPARAGCYRKRWGILCGVFYFFCFLSFASSRVWEIRVADRELDPVLREQLSSAGLYEGLASSRFDNDRFCADFLRDNPEYSFVSAGIEGGTALVWLNERSQIPPIESEEGGVNLVAGFDGEILWCEAQRGQVVVNHRETVEQGNLLVSGVVEMKSGGYRVEAACGKVFARTSRDFVTRIPLQREEKVYSGTETVRNSINILGKNLNFFAFFGKNGEFCDTIENREEVVLFGCLRMPFSLTRTTFAPYSIQSVSLSREQALRFAYDELYHFLFEELKEARVLEQKVFAEVENGELVFRATLSLVEDIAVARPFSYMEYLTDPHGDGT